MYCQRLCAACGCLEGQLSFSRSLSLFLSLSLSFFLCLSLYVSNVCACVTPTVCDSDFV